MNRKGEIIVAKKDIENLKIKEFIDIIDEPQDENDFEKDKREIERLFKEIEESELPQKEKDIVLRDLVEQCVKYFRDREILLLNVFRRSYIDPLRSTVLSCAKNFATKETIDARDLSIEEKLNKDLTHAIKILNDLKNAIGINYSDPATSEYNVKVKKISLTYERFLIDTQVKCKHRIITYIKEIYQNK